MGNPLGARQDAQFKAVCTAPSFNKTPVGTGTPPLPYPVSQDLSTSTGLVGSVRFNGDPAYVLDQSSQPRCIGDDPGTAGGIKSGTVNGEVKPTGASSTVRVGGQPIVRDGDPCTLNSGNCPGIYLAPGAPAPNLAADPNPPVAPETPEEQGFWASASPWVHGVLGVASFVPGLSVVTGAADAAIYAAEGDYVAAGLSAVSMIPGGKVATTAGKVVKGAAELVMAEKAAKAAVEVERAAQAAKLARAAEEAAKLRKLEEEAIALRKAKEGAAKPKPPGDGVQIKGDKDPKGNPATKNRVKLRKRTNEEIRARQPRNENGEMIDPNTRQPLKEGEIDVGHRTGEEWRTRKQMHEDLGSTRKEVIETENNPDLYRLEDRSSNRNHGFEAK